jgi:hypothetical protein
MQIKNIATAIFILLDSYDGLGTGFTPTPWSRVEIIYDSSQPYLIYTSNNHEGGIILDTHYYYKPCLA